MINIFITVGTTPFDELIKFCDENIDLLKYKVFAQISNESEYKVENVDFVKFTNEIEKYYKKADIVISHAGAGSVYKLLEMNKRTIFVPNFTMKDNHQDDICRFVQDNNYAEVLDVRYNQNINELLDKIINKDKDFNLYSNSNSNLVEEIYSILTVD